ncbi:hypothetical protein CC117_22420 [Parafrankia colletiae]|uniref:Leucine-binding protein domain-containing protein n=1 Tax=Parafrankia colletiae TaxID=573497 RepID=A0A1S1QKE6_9ACTN|nr:ABC transporter substrate-binding protein [Parafrankia colletiae]MCK9901833.1 ABC transporter substrate-binding protein [Frankia sp. Cpl3]OHV34056.1 hypothetical protein CC117_22420 [Parafrankia colletiae]
MVGSPLRRGGGRAARTRWYLGGAAVLAVVVVVVLVVVTGGSSGTSPDATATSASPRGGGVNLLAPPGPAQARPPEGPLQAPADATGVTGSTIRVGIQVLDAKVLTAAGLPTASVDLAGILRSFVDDMNARGGVNGRRIEPVFRTTNPIDQTAMRADCLAWSRDEKVFAVLTVAGFSGPPVRCLTEENDTIVIAADGQPEAWYQSAQGMLITMATAKERVLRNFAEWLDRTNVLEGRTVGLVSSGGTDGDAVEAALVPELTGRGQPVASRFTLSTDIAEQSRQYRVAIDGFRRAGVTTIVATTSYYPTAGLMAAAEQAGFRPQWIFSPFAAGTTDLSAGRFPLDVDAIGTANNRVGETVAGLPLAADEKACLDVYARQTGNPVDENDRTKVSTVSGACALFKIFETGLRNAGRDLDRRTFADGVQRIGRVTLPAAGASSFLPGKLDGADTSRVVRFQPDCRCWVPEPNSRLEPMPLL